MVNDELVYTALHYRILRTWASVEPFVHGERAIRGGENTFLNSFETAAKDIRNQHLKRDGQAVLNKIKDETERTRLRPGPAQDPGFFTCSVSSRKKLLVEVKSTEIWQLVNYSPGWTLVELWAGDLEWGRMGSSAAPDGQGSVLGDSGLGGRRSVGDSVTDDTERSAAVAITVVSRSLRLAG